MVFFPYANKRSRPGTVGESHPYNPFLVSHQRPAELIPPRTIQSQPYYPKARDMFIPNHG